MTDPPQGGFVVYGSLKRLELPSSTKAQEALLGVSLSDEAKPRAPLITRDYLSRRGFYSLLLKCIELGQHQPADGVALGFDVTVHGYGIERIEISLVIH